MISSTVHVGKGLPDFNAGSEKASRQVSGPFFWSCILLSGLLLLYPDTTWGQRDDFNDGDDAGWTHYDPIAMTGYPGVGSWTFPGGNTLRIQTSVSPAPLVVGPGRAGSLRTDVTYTDFYMTADLISWDTNLDQAIGLVARMHDLGPGMSDGYALTYQVPDHDIDITRFTNEDPADGELTLEGDDAVTLEQGHSYRFVFIGVGETLIARIYELPMGPFPMVDVLARDASFVSGYCGLLNFDNSGGTGTTDTTWDNYVAMEREPPRMEFTFIPSFPELDIRWPTNATGYILEGSPSLDEPVWTQIPADQISEAGGYYYYTSEDVTAAPQRRFFRLVNPE